MAKYTVERHFGAIRVHGMSLIDATEVKAALLKNNIRIATFHGDAPNNETNAQKVADLLNETSHSQGKYK